MCWMFAFCFVFLRVLYYFLVPALAFTGSRYLICSNLDLLSLFKQSNSIKKVWSYTVWHRSDRMLARRRVYFEQTTHWSYFRAKWYYIIYMHRWPKSPCIYMYVFKWILMLLMLLIIESFPVRLCPKWQKLFVDKPQNCKRERERESSS